MISALHLLWIIPLSVGFGFGICAVVSVDKDLDEIEELPLE